MRNLRLVPLLPPGLAFLAFLALLAFLAPPAAAQGTGLLGDALSSSKLKISVELKGNGRTSRDVSFRFTPVGVGGPLEVRTADPRGGVELSNVALTAEAAITPDISGKVVLHFLDLYSRNPTSSDDRVFVREAWGRFGRKYEALRLPPGTTLYGQLGKAPRFSKQLSRHLESYGLWGTAVGRFEEVGAEVGGSLGKHLYFRAAAASPNPVFFRDTNALAGDNGTPERTDPALAAQAPYHSGFPILYDAKATDTPFRGRTQLGGGLGVRFAFGQEERDGVDLLAWAFRRTLAERATLRGTIYSGELELLRGFPGGRPLALDGNEKWEVGANLWVRLGGLTIFGQWVYQEIAGLPRKGYEAEAAFRIPLNGLFLSGEQPVLNWIQPAVRVSVIRNDFSAAGYVAPSVGWDWFKLDGGVRIGVVRGVDVTAEYSRHDMILAARVLHPDEFLATLRVAF